MKRFLKALKAFAQHPATQLITGLVLLVSGGWEVVQDFLDAERRFQFGVHHGVALFGLIQMVGSLPELIEGLNSSFEAVEKRREE
jgi:hypothetical protein